MAVQEQIYRGSGQVSPAAALPEASANAFGAGIGEAIGGAGSELEASSARAMQAEKQRQREAETSQAGVNFANTAAEAAIRVNQAREEAPPGAPGHVDLVRNELKARSEAFLSTIKDPRVRDRYAPEIARWEGSILAEEDGWARGERVKNIGVNYRDATNHWANQLTVTGDEQTLETALGERQTTAGGLGLSEAVSKPLFDEASRALVNGYYEGKIEHNPTAAQHLLDTAENPVNDFLHPDDIRRLKDRADSAVHAQELAVDRQQRALASQAHDYLDVLGKRFADGDPTITDADLGQAQQLASSLGEAGKAYDVAKWRTWKSVDDAYKGASSLQISTALRALDSKVEHAGAKASPDDVVRRDRLQVRLDARQKEENADPLGTVDTQPLDLNDVGSIRSRVGSAHAAERETGRFAFFTPQELPVIRDEVSSGPQGRLQVIDGLARIASADPQAALRAAAQIDPQDRTLRHAMRVAPAVREMIVRGSVARQTLPKSVIGPDGKGASLDNLTQEWFADNVAPALVSAQPEFADDVLESTRAIYSDWRRRSNSAGQDEELNVEQLRRSAGLALGGMNGRGGVGDWQYGPKRSNGRAFPFVLPSGLTEDDAERRFGNPAIVAGLGKAPPGAVNGTPVWASGKPMSQYELTRKFVPVAVADGIYQFRAGNQVVHTADGHVFQADIRRLDPIHSVIAPKGAAPHLAPIAPVYPVAAHPEVRGPVYFAPGGRP